MKDVAIIILNYNGSDDTLECLDSIVSMDSKYQYDVYVLDNASKQEEYNKLLSHREFDRVLELTEFDNGCDAYKDSMSNILLIRSSLNLGFAIGNNRILDTIKQNYEYVLLLNNDTVVENSFLDDMVLFMETNRDISFGSCVINTYYDKTKLWNGGGKLLPWGNRRYFSQEEIDKCSSRIDAEFITGCALMVRNSIILNESLLTEKFFFGEEDFNMCMRFKKTHVRGACINKVLVYHKVSASSEREVANHAKIAVHFSNRIVDMKEFYIRPLWYVWKDMFIAVLWLNCFRWKLNGHKRRFVIKTVKHYASYEQISYAEYLEIKNNGSIADI